MQVVLTTTAALLLLAPSVAAYEGIDHVNGSVIRGSVTLAGPAPQLPAYEVTKDTKVCGDTVANTTYVVGKHGGFANVVVMLDGIDRGKRIDTPVVTLEHRWCRFNPRVLAIPKGSLLWIKNADPLLHTAHAYLGNTTVFNTALPPKGERVPKVINDTGIIRFNCDTGHTWMAAWVYVHENPYVTVTDKGGHFELTDVPPGIYTVKTWHEAAGTQSADARVELDYVTKLRIVYPPVKNGGRL